MKVIIFSNGFYTIGGAEDYVINRSKWLLQNGHQVLVIAHYINDIYKSRLGENCIPYTIQSDVLIHPCTFREKRKVRIISRLAEECKRVLGGCIDYIESHQVYPMLWGELLAEKLRTKNIVYFLAPVSRPRHKAFLQDKIMQKSLLGCSLDVLPRVYQKSKIISDYNFFFNIPVKDLAIYDQKVEENTFRYLGDKLTLTKEDVVISTMSRFEKTYLFNLINGVGQFAYSHPDLCIKLIIVGDGLYRDDLKNLSKLVEQNTTNLQICFTGIIEDTPFWLYRISNIYIGMGTTAIYSAALSCSTVLASPEGEGSSGLFGIHCNTFGYSDREYSYATILSDLVNDPSLYRESKTNARESFVTLFEENRINREFIKWTETVEIPKQYAQVGPLQGADLLKYWLSLFVGPQNSEIIARKVVELRAKWKTRKTYRK